MDPVNIKASIEFFKTPVQFAKGVGPYLAKLFKRMEIETFEDLLLHLPYRYLDRRNLDSLNKITPGKNRSVSGEIFAAGEVLLGRSRKKIFEAILSDGSGHVVAKWFRYNKGYYKKLFKKGDKFLFFGEISLYRGEKQMVHPEVQALGEILEQEELEEYLGLVPVYSLTEGLAQRQVRKAIQVMLEHQGDKISETLPASLLKEYGYPGLWESLQGLHEPEKIASPEHLAQGSTLYHQRLAFEELFYLQLGLALKKQKVHSFPGFKHLPRVQLRNELLSSLPFELTRSQIQASEKISLNMCSSEPMNVLLQGDVGSGKTIVGMLAALLAIENRHQVALMVPTEILAEQHNKNFKSLLGSLGVPIKLLTASTKNDERNRIFSELQKGEPMILIGTHALIEAEVGFENLSLVIIDEQHRFGVRQRMKLMKKGVRPDVMVMTATPIPRSLAMTLYGDLDLIVMTDLPKGRRPIQTRVMYEKNRSKLNDFVKKKVGEGRQAYFVFPLIEESEKLDLKDATKAFERLQKEFPEFKVGMIHGRMKGSEKDQIMQDFAAGETNILVATTVIEVGIDIPNATLMVIEHAERFGLSQLHQLRGRVGRGSEKSYCILATGFRQSDVAKTRLKVMEENTDGFKIAEEDLTIRGPGDFLGTRQSGIPDLKVANLIRDLPLLEQARDAAKKILQTDPALESEEHRAMKILLNHRWKERLGLAEVG